MPLPDIKEGVRDSSSEYSNVGKRHRKLGVKLEAEHVERHKHPTASNASGGGDHEPQDGQERGGDVCPAFSSKVGKARLRG